MTRLMRPGRRRTRAVEGLGIVAVLGVLAATVPGAAGSADMLAAPAVTLPDLVAEVTPATLYPEEQATVTAYPVTPSGAVSVSVLDDDGVEIAASSGTAEADRYAVFHLSDEGEQVLEPGSYEVVITDDTTGEVVRTGFDVRDGTGDRAYDLTADQEQFVVGETVRISGFVGTFSWKRVAVRPAGLIGPVTVIDDLVYAGSFPSGSFAITPEQIELPPGRYHATLMNKHGDFEPDYDATFEVVPSDGSSSAVEPSTGSARQETSSTARSGGAADPVPWGLDVLDGGPNGVYDPAYTGAGVTAYVLDTGIRTSHADFGGRANSGIDTVDGDADAADCNGRGTHLAGIVGGSTYGVATGVDIVGVRVMRCDGTGDVTDVVDGMRWVIDDHPAGRPGVMLVTWYGPFSRALNETVVAAEEAGIDVVMPAGDEGRDACHRRLGVQDRALVVAATDQDGELLPTSNTGIMPLFERDWACIGKTAPGLETPSAWHTSDTATATLTGTASAAAHAAGAAALAREQGKTVAAGPATLCIELSFNACRPPVRVESVTDGDLIVGFPDGVDGIDVAPGSTVSQPVDLFARVPRDVAQVSVSSSRSDIDVSIDGLTEVPRSSLYGGADVDVTVTAAADARPGPPPQVVLHIDYDGETTHFPLDVRVSPRPRS